MNASRSARDRLRRRLRTVLSEPEGGEAARQRVLATQFFASVQPGASRLLPLFTSRVRS